ncbi:MAG: MarR family transcriptional regulator [Bacteroidales bacterium]|nr:MarR family transcriptional regulator [Bacteroidales bacterium]
MKNEKEEQNQSVGKVIGELSRAAHVFFNQQFKKYSIGHAQVRTLHFISQNNGITQAELTKYLKLDKSSVTSQLASLEKNAYIKRTISSTDARIRNINITDKTKNIFSALMKVFSSWTNILLDGFSEKEKIDVFILLEKMRENAQNKINELKENEE